MLGSRAGDGEGGPILGFLSAGVGDLCLEHRAESVSACTNLMSRFGHAIHVCTACCSSVSSGLIGIGRSMSPQRSSVIRSTKTGESFRNRLAMYCPALFLDFHITLSTNFELFPIKN